MFELDEEQEKKKELSEVLQMLQDLVKDFKVGRYVCIASNEGRLIIPDRIIKQ